MRSKEFGFKVFGFGICRCRYRAGEEKAEIAGSSLKRLEKCRCSDNMSRNRREPTLSGLDRLLLGRPIAVVQLMRFLKLLLGLAVLAFLSQGQA
jgi:hypothetical protein